MPNSNQPTLRAINSPYNFVPLHERVHLPEWGELVSHDVPFKEGVDAEIHYTLTAESPLLVGGHHTSSDGRQPGEVYPFKLRNGENSYAIPGSSLKGMLRAVLEIAGFGRMRMVDDRALSVRDLTAGARFFYRNKMTDDSVKGAYRPKVQSGWVEFDDSGKPWITPCAYSRVEHDDLAKYSDDPIWEEFPEAPGSKFKYETWEQSGSEFELWFQPEPETSHHHSRGKLIYSKATSLGTGSKWGTLVFTGQPHKRDRQKPGCKHMEFIFYEDQQESVEKFEVEDSVWRAFLQIHENSKEWEYWRHEPYVPIFYLTDKNGATSLGLAQMYRLAYEHSIGETIEHASSEHRRQPGVDARYDLADLLFGAVGEGEMDSLRGRVSVETATLESQSRLRPQEPTILNSPKPSFYPNYVVQKTIERVKLDGQTYQTYVTQKIGEHKNRRPQIRGFKRYPARPENDVAVQALSSDQSSSASVQVRLFPLDKRAQFKGRIVCHNLQPIELGALLWVMTWGNRDKLRHSLGMAKPFGFGQVRISIDHSRSTVRPNDPKKEACLLNDDQVAEFMAKFVEHMRTECPAVDWEQTPQLANLLAMADPDAAAEYKQATGSSLEYMQDPAAFTKAKKASLVLPDYASATSYAVDERSAGAMAGAGRSRSYGHPWLDSKIPELMRKHNSPEDAMIRGKALATAWSEIEDSEEKEAVKKAIETLWHRDGIFEMNTKKSRKIYGW